VEIPKVVQELPDAPKGVRDWILKDIVTGRYMIYSTKEDRAVCTYCGKVFVPSRGDLVPVPRNNEKVTCPCCNAKATYKSKGIGRSNLTEMTRVMVFVKRGKSIFATVSEIDISFENEKPKISKWIAGVYKFNSKEQIYYTHRAGWYSEESWVQMKSIRCPRVTNGFFGSKRQDLHIYNKNFDRIFNYSDLKYADVEDVYRHKGLTGEQLIRYIHLSLKFLSIEILRKSGFWHLVYEKIIEAGGSGALNWKATEHKKIFNLNRYQIKEVRDANLNLMELEIYKRQIKKGEPVSPEQSKLIKRYYPPHNGKGIEDFTTLSRVSSYILNQNKKEQGGNRVNSLNDYLDYMNECEKLGYNLDEKKTKFPKYFSETHIETSKRVREMREEEDRIRMCQEEENQKEDFEKTQQKLTGMNEPYIADGLMMILAASPAELRAEGRSLGHCVGGYARKVTRGESAILFVRTVADPSKSFYTLELTRDKTIAQCRGNGNCVKTPEVEAFVNKWFEEVILNKKVKKEKVA